MKDDHKIKIKIRSREIETTVAVGVFVFPKVSEVLSRDSSAETIEVEIGRNYGNLEEIIDCVESVVRSVEGGAPLDFLSSKSRSASSFWVATVIGAAKVIDGSELLNEIGRKKEIEVNKDNWIEIQETFGASVEGVHWGGFEGKEGAAGVFKSEVCRLSGF
jgi:hypothetical protein